MTAILTSNLILTFDEVGKGDVPRVGGKAANLGEMARAQLPVPPGFVVTVDAYDRAIDESGLRVVLDGLLARLNVDDAQSLQAISAEAQRRVRELTVPADVRHQILHAYDGLTGETHPFVAVRSSATVEDAPSASFAGMFESYLFVRGADDVIAKVRECWASAFGARVLFYRAKQSLSGGMPVAVVVQRMIASEKSGVMFTADPSTHDADRIVIESAWGLGEPIVQGQVTPDRYVLDKASLGLRHLHVATKQFMLSLDPITGQPKRTEFSDSERVLTDAELAGLGDLARRAEKFFGTPQDLEFAIDGTGIYLVQTRPITTLKPATAPAGTHRVVARGLGASPGIASGAVRVIRTVRDGVAMRAGEILVAPMTSPDWVPLMRRAAAIVTDSGGMTSHAAIVSRELGVPCVVGAQDATRALRDAIMVTVDGSSGTVTEGAAAMRREAPSGRVIMPPPAAAPRPTGNAPVTATRLYVNLADPTRAEAIAAMPVDGVGLLRAETMLVEALDGVHPKQLLIEGKRDAVVEKLAAPIARIARAFYPRPVIYRAMDFRSNEFRALRGGERHEPVEANPMIGYRGCFRYVSDPDLFAVELLALHEVRGTCDNVHLMIPFVRTPWELRRCLDILDHSPLRTHRSLQRWIMAEVPSVVWHLREYAALGITGLSIGSNDLTQLILGVDRDNARLAPLYDERDPAVLGAIRRIISVAHARGMTASICGQAPSVHEQYAEYLVRCGIDSISVTSDAIERTRRNVARAEKRLLLERANGRARAAAPAEFRTAGR